MALDWRLPSHFTLCSPRYRCFFWQSASPAIFIFKQSERCNKYIRSLTKVFNKEAADLSRMFRRHNQSVGFLGCHYWPGTIPLRFVFGVS